MTQVTNNANRKRYWAQVHWLFVLVLALWILPAQRTAEASGFIIHIGPGKAEFPLAVPKPEGSDELTQPIWDVVLRDLEMCGYFKLINPDAYIDQSGSILLGEFDFADWRLIQAAGLAKTSITKTADGIQADIYIYDVNGGTKVLGKRLTMRGKKLRYLGHRIASTVLEALTGEPGFFDARLAAVGSQTGNKEIYVLDIDGNGVRPVTRNGSINLSPAWDPTGKRIAWTSYKRQNPDLYVKDLRSGRTRVLSSKRGINIGAAFSPDGKHVAMTRSTNGDSDIYILDASNGRVVQRITKGGGIDVSPSFSPDGTKVAFASERSGGSQIFITDLTSGETRRISRQGSFNADPVWSPDSKKIAFVGRDPTFDIFVFHMENDQTIRITEHMGHNEDPSWSPDSRYLLFSSTRKGRSEIWLATADGRHQVPVTTRSGGWSQPTWAPN